MMKISEGALAIIARSHANKGLTSSEIFEIMVEKYPDHTDIISGILEKMVEVQPEPDIDEDLNTAIAEQPALATAIGVEPVEVEEILTIPNMLAEMTKNLEFEHFEYDEVVEPVTPTEVVPVPVDLNVVSVPVDLNFDGVAMDPARLLGLVVSQPADVQLKLVQDILKNLANPMNLPGVEISVAVPVVKVPAAAMKGGSKVSRVRELVKANPTQRTFVELALLIEREMLMVRWEAREFARQMIREIEAGKLV
jgi:hypothetical protein